MTEIDQLRQGGTRLVECIEHPNGPHEWVCLTCVESSEEELEASLAEKDETICDERIGRKSAEARCETLEADQERMREAAKTLLDALEARDPKNGVCRRWLPHPSNLSLCVNCRDPKIIHVAITLADAALSTPRQP